MMPPTAAVLAKRLGVRVVFVIGLGFALSAAISTQGRAEEAPTPAGLEAYLDSLAATADTLVHWETLAPAEFLADSAWTPAGSDSARAHARRFDYAVLPSAGFSKVEGSRSGLDASLEVTGRPEIRLDLGASRAFGWKQWEGDAGLSVGWGGPPATRRVRERISGGPDPRQAERDEPAVAFSLAWERRAAVFGANRPFANSILAGLASLDRQEYLDRRAVTLGLSAKLTTITRAELAYEVRSERPLRAREHGLFEWSDEWERNAQADRVRTRGLVARWLWRKGVEDAIVVRVATHGGMLGGERDHSTLGFETRARYHAPGLQSIDLVSALAVAGGDAPAQERPDLGGVSNLRAYPTRAFVGASSYFVRLDIASAEDPLRDVSFLRWVKLQPLAFADGGAVWGERPWREFRTEFPESSDWKFDAGVGLRREVPLLGPILFARVDAAWRFDRSRDRLTWVFSLEP